MPGVTPGGGEALEEPPKGSVPVESGKSGKSVGPHDGPSPDPHQWARTTDREAVAREPVTGEVSGAAEELPESEGDAIHLEDDRIR